MRVHNLAPLPPGTSVMAHVLSTAWTMAHPQKDQPAHRLRPRDTPSHRGGGGGGHTWHLHLPRPVSAGVTKHFGRCRHVSGSLEHMETHTQTQSTDLNVDENQAMFCKRKEMYLGP